MARRGLEPNDAQTLPDVAPATLVEEWPRLAEESRAWILSIWIKSEKDSHNSHKPPSGDLPNAKAKTNAKRRRKGKKPRSPGGQKGHPGHHRPLVPADRVDKRVDHFPTECRGCGKDLRDEAPDPEPLHHQIAEIPEIRPTVTDHARHRVTCSDCDTTTTAPLPESVPTSCFGPNLRALIVLLSGRYRISRRETVELCRDLFGVSVSVGCVARILERTSDALEVPYDEIASAVKSSPVAHMDETGWREKGNALHLWILVAAFAVLFRIGRRTKAVAQEMLGEHYSGRVVTDRYGAYRWIPDEQHQVCWAHLKRDFEGLAERGGAAKVIGEALLTVSEDLFAIWHAYKDGRIRWETMQRRMATVEVRAGTLLEEGSESRNAATKRLCKSLRSIEPSLFVFARVEGVEPTNNIGERGIRPAVQWRKTCFGTQSEGGSRFVERILTVVATCRLQERPLLPYLRDVIIAADSGGEVPSLTHARMKGDPRSHGPPRTTGDEMKEAG